MNDGLVAQSGRVGNSANTHLLASAEPIGEIRTRCALSVNGGSMNGDGRRLMVSIMTMSLFLLGCGESGNSTHPDQAPKREAVPSPEPDTTVQPDSGDQSAAVETHSGKFEEDGDTPGAEVSRGSITVEITPLRTSVGIIYGAEARDQSSGTLLATAKQVAMDGDMLVVEETQYSPNGDVVYEGKLYFSAGDELVREERTSGQKRWNVFHTWISDRPGF